MRGGARPGAGRPPKADEERVRTLAVAAIEKKHGSLEDGFRALLETGEACLIKFVWEHAVGKPREKMDVGVSSPLIAPAIVINAPEGLKVEFPSNTDGEE